jgi:ribosomal protein S11
MTNIPKYVIIYIKGTNNNTIVSVMDVCSRYTLYTCSGGLCTKLGREKGNTRIGSQLFENVSNYLTENKIENIEIRSRNVGSAYAKHLTSAVKLIISGLKNHYNLIRTINNTPLTHGYIRPQKPKKK